MTGRPRGKLAPEVNRSELTRSQAAEEEGADIEEGAGIEEGASIEEGAGEEEGGR